MQDDLDKEAWEKEGFDPIEESNKERMESLLHLYAFQNNKQEGTKVRDQKNERREGGGWIE